MIARSLIALAFLLPMAGAATAEVAVVSGGRVRLDTMGAFDQACHSLGPMSVSILQAPRSGTVIAERTNEYPNYPAFNTRSRCNTTRLPETRLMYQSAPGFFGDDAFSAEWIGPTGSVIRRFYRISVRPGVLVPGVASEAPFHMRRHSRHAAMAPRHHAATAPMRRTRDNIRRSPRPLPPAPSGPRKIET